MKFIIILLINFGLVMTSLGAEVPKYLKHVENLAITPEYCDNLQGHLLAEFVFDRILYNMAAASKNHDEGVAIVLPQLSPPLRTFYLFRVADAEIGNGGLWGFFGLGEYPRYVNETIEAFRVFGLDTIADLLEETAVIHKQENLKLEAAKKKDQENEFYDSYSYTAYDALEAKLEKLDWDFDKNTEGFLRKNIREMKE